jgi:hypothetical protein
MTLPRLNAMNEYWESNPPMHQLLAGYVGYKKPDKAEPEKEVNLDELIKALGG